MSDRAAMPWLLALLCAACSLESSSKIRCETQAHCLDGYVCTAGVCELPAACVPKACEANQCERLDDGCGGKLDCGACTNGQQCGVDEANVCGTPPPHCTNQTHDPSLGETGVDCGGACGGCPTGGSCATTDDCAAGNTCSDDVCLAGTWSTVAPIPTAREQLAAVLGPDGLIYAIGGLAGENLVEVYNPVTNSWSARAPMPTGRYGLTAVVGNDGKIYAIGGDYTNVSDEGASIAVEAYDPVTDTWTTLPSLSPGRFHPAAAVASDGTIYVTGGFNIIQYQTLSSTVKLAPGAASWTAVTPAMTSPRTKHALVRADDGKLYALGGDSGSAQLASVEYMTPGTPGWHTLPAMTQPRLYFPAVVRNGQIYAIGGFASGVQGSERIEVYTPATNTWSRAPNLPAGRYGHAAVALPDGRIFVISGRRASSTTQSARTAVVEVLTP